MQFCHALRPQRILVENEQSRKLVFPVTDALLGIKPLPSCYAAPEHSITEVGQQNVQELLDESRLHIEHLLPILRERDQSDRALRFAVNHALEFTAFYAGKKRNPLDVKLLGTKGL